MSEEFTEDQIKQAIEALKSSGYNVLTQDQMSQRLRQATKEIGPLKERLDELESQYTSATKALKQYEDKDKSAEQRIADELKAKQEQIEAWEAKYQKQQQLITQEQQKAKDMFLTNELHGMLGKSVSPSAAVKLALSEIEGLSVETDDSGKFRLAYTGPDKLPGDPAEAVNTWFKEQSFLHPPAGDGVPTSSVNPPNSSNGKSWNNMSSEDRFDHVFFEGGE